MIEISHFVLDSLEVLQYSPIEGLSRVLKLICGSVGCEFGAILTIDEQNNLLALDVLHGYPETARSLRSQRLKLPIAKGSSTAADSLFLNVGKEGGAIPLILSGSSSNQFSITRGVKEVLAYPVSRGGVFVAVLVLESLRAGVFKQFENNPKETSLLTICSNIVSLALAARQSLVAEFDQFIKGTNFPDQDALRREAMRWVYEKFKVNSCILSFIVYDHETGQDYLIAEEMIINNVPQTGRRNRLSIGEGYGGWVAAHNASLMLTDFDDLENPELDYYAAMYGSKPHRKDMFRDPSLCFKSYLGVPVTSDKQVVGVLEILETEREYAFNDEGLLEMIAQRIGSEFHRISRDRRRESLFSIPNIHTRDLSQVIQGVVDAAMRLTSATHGFFMYKEVEGVFHARAVSGHNLTGSSIRPVEAWEDTLVNLVITNHSDFLCGDVMGEREHLDERHRECLDNTLAPDGFIPKGISSLLMVPVYMKDLPADKIENESSFEDIGVLVLMSYKRNVFQQDEVAVTALAEIVSYHIWANRKLSELKEQQEQIQRLDQDMAIYNRTVAATAISAGTVHTAKKHILEVRGMTELLLNHRLVADVRELREAVHLIHKGVSELHSLYDRLHDIFGGMEHKFETCSLTELIGEAVEYMTPTFRQRRVQFSNLLGKIALPKFQADPLLMKVVFINLIRNSIEAGARKISARARLTDFERAGFKKKAIEVTFTDDGVGIPEEILNSVFMPFVTANKKGGTGLGLTVNQDILGKHGGSISVTSSVVGKGTSISLVMPIE